MLLKNCIWHKL